MRFLLIPGLAKSGTTYLFDQLSKNPDHFNPTKRKEVNYFGLGGTDLGEYLSLFREPVSSKWYLDATPQYLENGITPIKNIAKTLRGHEVKVVVCLREPFSRYFSHYLHDLKRHVAHFDVRDFLLLDHNAYSINSIYKYLIARAPQVRLLMDLFGQDNVLPFSISSSALEWRNLGILENFLGADDRYTYKTERVSNPGGWIPRIHYSASKYIEVQDGASIFRLPPRCLLIRNGTDSRLVKEFPLELAERVVRLSQNWSIDFRPTYLGKVYGEVWDDYVRTLELLDHKGNMETPLDVYHANEPTLSQKVIKELQVVAKIEDDAAMIWNAPNVRNSLSDFPDYFELRHSYGTLAKHISCAKGKRDARELTKRLIEEFEFSPKWISTFLALCIETESFNEAVDYVTRHPYVKYFINMALPYQAYLRITDTCDDADFLKLGELLDFNIWKDDKRPHRSVDFLTTDERFYFPIKISRNSKLHWLALQGDVINISYHWLNEEGHVVVFEGLRTAFPKSFYDNADDVTLSVAVQAPEIPGRYVLQLLPVQEGVAWFDDLSFYQGPIAINVVSSSAGRTFRADDIRFRTQVGMLDSNAVVSTMREGILLEGPRCALSAGHWQLQIAGAFESRGGTYCIYLCSQDGGVIHGRVDASSVANSAVSVLATDFELVGDVSDLDISIFVDDSAHVRVTSITLTPKGGALP